MVTYRDDEVGANPPLGLLLGDLATRAAVRRLVVLGAYETLGITDLDAGDPAQWVAGPVS